LNYGDATDSEPTQEFPFTVCDQCKLNGIPNRKIVLVYLGIRPVEEPGFIYKFLAYDYSEKGAKLIHQHRFDPALIERQVNSIFHQKVMSAH
jgi:hypothetical protein